MSRKKTYRELKADGKTKLPAATWVLERKAIYVGFTLVSVLAMGAFGKMGWDSYNRSIQAPEVITPYIELASVNSVGKNWAAALIAKKPEGAKKWTVSDNSKPQSIVDSKICGHVTELPTSLLSTHIGNGSGIETRVQVYGAGQAAKQFDEYVKSLNSCFGNVFAEKDGKSRIAKFSNGFILTAGDAIVSVTTSDESTRDRLLTFYLNNVEKTLQSSGCLALPVNSEDSTRSFFYNKDSYKGFDESKKLQAGVDTHGLPLPTEIQFKEISNKFATEPEAPLPEDFPKLPKKEIEKPSIPTAPEDVSTFIGTATYEIADQEGPGCGWAWSAQVSPVFNLQKLEKSKLSTLDKLQGKLDGDAQEYVDGKVNWALSVASAAPKADLWNEYVNEINQVHKKWSWLNIERSNIRGAWYSYVANHDYWTTFDARKAAAISEFDEKMAQCERDAAILDEWNDKWGSLYYQQENAKKAKENSKNKNNSKAHSNNGNSNNVNSLLESPAIPQFPASPSETPSETEPPLETEEPTETPTDPVEESPSTEPETEIPPRPAGCNPPEEPAIINQTKPAEPKPPVIPNGVTIPNSWPTPKN